MAGHTFVYDEHDRLVDQVLPAGGHKRAHYTALSTTVTVDGLAPVARLRDGLGRIVHTERNVGMVREEVDAIYDPAGMIKRLSLQGGAVLHDFTYDSLGRLVAAHDPDSRSRTFVYDDRGLLTSETNAVGQTISYTYDDAGRVTRVDHGQGRAFVYHYDIPKGSTEALDTLGRIAWIEEPGGEAQFAYDARGRLVRTLRSAHGHSVEEQLTLATSGALLSTRYDDGFELGIEYDDAGRPIKVPGFWEATQLNASGTVAEETFANGIRQHYERDTLGLTSRIRVARPSGVAALDVAIQRNAFMAVTSVQDGDGVGLDHTATYDYDAAGRLVRSEMGTGSQAFTFTYAYDGLQNMVSRTALGPKQLGMLHGTYTFGEGGASPRQVTRITNGGTSTQLRYDSAGRLTSEADNELAYGAFDELLSVTNRAVPAAPTLVAEHDYGFDGIRTWTRNADGTEQVWLAPHITDKNGRREYSVRVGTRTIAKAAADLPATAARGGFHSEEGAGVLPEKRALGAGGLAQLAIALFAVLILTTRRARISPRSTIVGRLATALGLLLLAVNVGACVSEHAGSEGTTALQTSAWTTAERRFFHEGVAAGPILVSRDDGSILEERRYEPFGEPIDAYREAGGTSSVGDVDFRQESRNGLNKDADPNTGWSYHGARWMAPQMARWLTPDPPTRAPDPTFLEAPWDLNPYAYSRGNPTLYWDADGRWPVLLVAAVVVGVVFTCQYANAPERADTPLRHKDTQEMALDMAHNAAMTYSAARFAGAAATTVAADGVLVGTTKVVGTAVSGTVVGAGVHQVADTADPSGKLGKVADIGMGVASGVRSPGLSARVGTPRPAPAPKRVGALPKPPTGKGSVPEAARDPKRVWTPAERAAKREVQGGQCATGCGTKIDQSNSRGHHIERHADGGKTNDQNHAEVCVDCHKELHSGD